MRLFNAPVQAAGLSAHRASRLRPHKSVHWVASVSAVLTWAVAGFVVAYWVLRWVGQSPPVALPLPMSAPLDIDSQAVARALGAVPVVAGPAAPQPDASGRYLLMGVVADGGQSVAGQSHRVQTGVALIAIDGQRARPYAVGAQVDGRWVVHQVTRRNVVLRPVGVNGAADGAVGTDPLAGSLTLAMRPVG